MKNEKYVKDENKEKEWYISLLIEMPSFLHINAFFIAEKDGVKIPCVAYQIGEEEEEYSAFTEFLRCVKLTNEETEEMRILMKMIDMIVEEE